MSTYIRSPSPQPLSPSHRHSSIPSSTLEGLGVPSTASSYRNPHSRQSLGPPPSTSSSRAQPSSPGAPGYRHVSLSGDRLAEARAASPNPADYPQGQGQGQGEVIDLSYRSVSVSGAGTTERERDRDSMGGRDRGQRISSYGLTPSLAGGGGGGSNGGRTTPGQGMGGFQGVRPASEYIGSGMRRQPTPEPQDNPAWANDLADYERTLEALTQASLDESFTAELSAIEQWFRVLSESERTATLYSLLQHSTRTQVKFFSSVLATMSQSDPLTSMMSPGLGSTNNLQQAQSAMAGLRSPSGTSNVGFPTSSGTPVVNQFLAPESAADNSNYGSASAQLAAQRTKNRNRISAPGTLLGGGGADAQRYIGGNLDDVIERGGSPFDEPQIRPSPRPDGGRPATSDFSGLANIPYQDMSPFPRSPRPEDQFTSTQNIGLGLPSPGLDQIISPLLVGSWASSVNTPQIPVFTHNRAQQPDPNALNQALASTTMHLASMQSELANLQMAGQGHGRQNPITLSDPSQFRRTGGASSGRSNAMYSNDGEMLGTTRGQPGQPGQPGGLSPMLSGGQWNRSPMVGGGNEFGLGLGMGSLGMGMGMDGGSSYTPRQGSERVSSRTDRSRRSPLLRQSPSPSAPPTTNTGGGAGSGAGVAGEDDVDERVLKDVANWLRILRLHKYTPNFQASRWQDMAVMTESDLEAKGVAAQGARRKLLKAFANIRDHYGIPHPADFDRETLFAPAPAAGSDSKDS